MESAEELRDKYLAASERELEARFKLQSAMEHAIDTKIWALTAHRDWREADGASKRELMKIHRDIMFLAQNRHFISPFVYAPLDTSWRKRVLGF